jgi:hypothetical protein
MFTSKIISNKNMRAGSYCKSTVMKDLLSKGGDKILKTSGDRAAFWKAMRQEGKGGFTNSGLKSFFGKMMRNSGDRFSNKKVRDLSRIFNPNGKSYTYSGSSASSGNSSSQHVATTSSNIQKNEKPRVDMNKVMDEIRSKRATFSQPKADIPQREASKVIDFRKGDDGIRKAGSLIAKTPEKMVYDETGKADGANDIRARLAAIQGKSD